MGRECSATEKRLERYFDGELSRRAAAGVEDHLAACPQCRARLESLKTLRQLMVESVGQASATVPEGFWERVEARLDSPEARRPWLESFPGWIRLNRPVWTLASATAALLLVLVILHPWRQPVLASNECDIDFLEAEYSTVMVLETPDSKMKIIWVDDSQFQSEEDVSS